MKATQALTTMAWLFPLASMAASSTTSSSPTPASSSSSADTWPTQYSKPTEQQTKLWKNLGCFKAAAGKNPNETPDENPLSTDGTGMVSYGRTFTSASFCTTMLCNVGEFAAVTQGDACYCASVMDTGIELVDDKNCNVPCKGWAQETCGGVGYLQVYENLDPDLGEQKTTLGGGDPSATAPPSGSGGAQASSTSTGAPAPSSSVPAGANSNSVAQSLVGLAAGVGMALFM